MQSKTCFQKRFFLWQTKGLAEKIININIEIKELTLFLPKSTLSAFEGSNSSKSSA